MESEAQRRTLSGVQIWKPSALRWHLMPWNWMRSSRLEGLEKKKKDMGGLSSDAGQHLEEEEPLKLWGDQENSVMGA